MQPGPFYGRCGGCQINGCQVGSQKKAATRERVNPRTQMNLSQKAIIRRAGFEEIQLKSTCVRGY